jgi:hypothetical protein
MVIFGLTPFFLFELVLELSYKYKLVGPPLSNFESWHWAPRVSLTEELIDTALITMNIATSVGAAATAPVSTMASAMLFGTIIFAAAALATRAFLMGDHKMFEGASNPRSSPLDVKSLSSVYTLMYHSSIFGLILFYAYICEYHPPFPHSDKNYDADMFFFLTFLLFVVAAFTWKKHDHTLDAKKSIKSKVSVDEDSSNADSNNSTCNHSNNTRAVAEANDKTEILNRDQTEEWKGWMQFMFLLYHYCHAEPVYNAIRIMITCYVWMTGFGNFSFFYLKADFGSVRVMQMMWRLNFLVLFLCLTQGTTYILYYICLLHTYYFCMVYVTMRIGYEKNHTKWWIRIKLAVLALIIFLVWDCDLGLFRLVHYPFLGEHAKLGANAGAMWEWYFRSTLDHWSTYLGMIFALNFPITSLFYRKLEAQPLLWHVLGKGLVGLALLVALYVWTTGPFMQGKFDYNQTNSYYGFVPLITYIYFRNLTPWLRNHTLELLHQIGKTTLETYLMQHHIWLTSNAKSLLTLIPGCPKVNFLLVSLLYVFLSRRLYQLTLFLRGMMLPDNRDACFKNLMGMGTVIGIFCSLAWLLDHANMLSLQAVGIISMACGYLLYVFLLRFTARPGEAPAEESTRDKGRAVGLTAPYLVGAIFVLFCGMGWHSMALKGATKILPLPATCQAYVNTGKWVTLNGCDEGTRGQEYRDAGIAPESTCSSQNSAYVWGWNQPKSSTHCRFKQRDPKSLKNELKSRTIVFAGDSITRYLYHSFCRQLGVKDAGAYNATEGKHHDINRLIGDIQVDFVWAGFAPELADAAKNITKMPLYPPKASVKKRPDMVILGGGAWDKLWMYSTDEEKMKLKRTYGELASQMQQLRQLDIPVVWFVPTTVNTEGLPSEEKRMNINEEEMEVIRSLHQSEGVLSSSSFVIDGPAFTAARVSESFDGVHYPHQVYSAGAQILANAADWLLPEPLTGEPKPAPRPGAMAHEKLGLMIFFFAFFGIVGFDGFMGFSYLAAIFVPSVAPARLYQEAFSSLHRKMNLPAIEMQAQPSVVSDIPSPPSSGNFDEEAVGLLGKDS